MTCHGRPRHPPPCDANPARSLGPTTGSWLARWKRHMTMRILFACSLLTGCAFHPASSDGGDDDVVPPSPPPPPIVVVASGAYQVRSLIDLTVEAVLPEPAEQLVVTLREFSERPAHTLIDLADEAGVPAVSELRTVLPDVLEGRLEGWIDDEIAKV